MAPASITTTHARPGARLPGRAQTGPCRQGFISPRQAPPPHPRPGRGTASFAGERRTTTTTSTAAAGAPPPDTAGADLTPLPAIDLTPEAFAPFGQVITPTDDGTPYGPGDAALALPLPGPGAPATPPRLYIMTLPARAPHPLAFRAITYHAHVSQCLAALDGAWAPWYLAVSAPSGSVDAHPDKDDIVAFRIPPGVFVKLHPGTWHAGPLFDAGPTMAFANLEMADTNVTDHNTHVYREGAFVVVPPGG